jgi:arsenate reductase
VEWVNSVPPANPLRILFLCTGNSARSQIAEAILTRKARGRFVVASAGSQPAARVNPLTVSVLREFGIDWSGHTPKGIDAVIDEPCDLIITVCDRARETCPVFPSRPTFAHWGMPDPAAVAGSEDARVQAFRDTIQYLSRRIDLLLALPVERLERMALELRVRAIATEAPVESPSAVAAETEPRGPGTTT